jgi:tellurite methyltransferase
MDIRGWDARYRTERESEWAPTPLLIETAKGLKPGRALDLACGTGRNALWLAQQGWSVTAVDGSAAAIEILNRRAVERGVLLDAHVADLEKGEYEIEPASWEFIAICYYLQRDLIEPAKRGVKRGGVLLVIVHIKQPGELAGYFQDWEILHSYEGKPNDPVHARAVAEIVARKV